MKLQEFLEYDNNAYDWEDACQCDLGADHFLHGYKFENNWMVCKHCGKPRFNELNECSECGHKFKGFKPNLPFLYTGPCCE